MAQEEAITNPTVGECDVAALEPEREKPFHVETWSWMRDATARIHLPNAVGEGKIY